MTLGANHGLPVPFPDTRRPLDHTNRSKTDSSRRVLCHPQPNGLPCPRCIEKNNLCTTTPTIRVKKRKVSPTLAPMTQLPPQCEPPPIPFRTQPTCQWDLMSASAHECPDLRPELVRHLFECFVRTPEYMHPVFGDMSIKTAVQEASFQLNIMPPPSRVLVLCIIAFASLISFDEAVLGPGPRPQSFNDTQFFLSDADARGCGTRRAAVCRALHLEALRTAWDAKIMLEVSRENAASCLILSHLELYDFHGPSRPWASAFASHLRPIASTWKESDIERYGPHWSAHFMAEAIGNTRHRKPSSMTRHDQILLYGSEPSSLLVLLTLLEKSRRRDIPTLFQYTKPYAFHVTVLARQLYETITGDYARLRPLSEAAVISYISSLTALQSILSILLEPVDTMVLTSSPPMSGVFYNGAHCTVNSMARACGFSLVIGFTDILLPFYRELELRVNADNTAGSNKHAHARLLLLRNQAHEMAVLGARLFGKAIGYLPPLVHRAHTQWVSFAAWAEFCLDEANGSVVPFPEHIEVLEAIASKLNEVGYSLDLSPYAGLIKRLEGYISGYRNPTFERSLPSGFHNTWGVDCAFELGADRESAFFS
ncbi:hypothetical protein C8J57DRAFT_1275901 [Mycena rebaudengoi]|nr:hypothetical protein C8J57DRAFT_1275901 [Mycena rebaudengoi]